MNNLQRIMLFFFAALIISCVYNPRPLKVIPKEKNILNLVTKGIGKSQNTAFLNAQKNAVLELIFLSFENNDISEETKLTALNSLENYFGYLDENKIITIKDKYESITLTVSFDINYDLFLKDISTVVKDSFAIDNNQSFEDLQKQKENFIEFQSQLISVFSDITKIIKLNTTKVNVEKINNTNSLIKIDFLLNINYEEYEKRINSLKKILDNNVGLRLIEKKKIEKVTSQDKLDFYDLGNFHGGTDKIIPIIVKEDNEFFLEIFEVEDSFNQIDKALLDKDILNQKLKSLTILIEFFNNKKNILHEDISYILSPNEKPQNNTLSRIFIKNSRRAKHLNGLFENNYYGTNFSGFLIGYIDFDTIKANVSDENYKLNILRTNSIISPLFFFEINGFNGQSDTISFQYQTIIDNLLLNKIDSIEIKLQN